MATIQNLQLQTFVFKKTHVRSRKCDVATTNMPLHVSITLPWRLPEPQEDLHRQNCLTFFGCCCREKYLQLQKNRHDALALQVSFFCAAVKAVGNNYATAE